MRQRSSARAPGTFLPWASTPSPSRTSTLQPPRGRFCMLPTVDLVCADPKTVHQIWPQARQLIKTAIEHTGLSEFSDIEYDVLSGDQLLWLAISDHIEAAATTHLIKTS